MVPADTRWFRGRFFLAILAGPGTARTLEAMHRAHLLEKLVPAFSRVRGLMQFNQSHKYTVDEHTIRAIGILSRIETGDLEEDHPLASKIVHKVLSRPVLYLAVLLHDIAKGRRGDHSVLGAEVAERLCPRLGLDAAQTLAVIEQLGLRK